MAGFKKRGLGVAALSYDSVDVLKDFTNRRGITYPLLSDPDSKIIRAFGIINEIDHAPGTPFHGIPFPGTFVTDGKGMIVTKDFEKSYQERRTASSLLAQLGDQSGASVKVVQNDQFTLRTSASNDQGAPGHLLTLALDFDMGSHMHAYAPGVTGYRALALRLNENPFIKAHEVVFPKAVSYTFKPLKETVQVFEGKFRVLQDVTIVGPARPAPGTAPVPPPTQTEITGVLDYQVCSDTLCHAPASMPVSWTIKLNALDRERAPEALRKK